MTETTGVEAKTLHRLLEIGKINEDGLYKKNQDYQGTPIDGDIIIVDEMSMVDLFLMNYLMQSVYQGSKLILVGDPNSFIYGVKNDYIDNRKTTLKELIINNYKNV